MGRPAALRLGVCPVDPGLGPPAQLLRPFDSTCVSLLPGRPSWYVKGALGSQGAAEGTCGRGGGHCSLMARSPPEPFKLFNSPWKGRVTAWSADVISMQVSAFSALSHTVLFCEREAWVCVCWPDTQHVWSCQDSAYLSRVPTHAPGGCWDTEPPAAPAAAEGRTGGAGRGPDPARAPGWGLQSGCCLGSPQTSRQRRASSVTC